MITLNQTAITALKAQIALESARLAVVNDSNALTRSSLANTELNTFNKNDIIQFFSESSVMKAAPVRGRIVNGQQVMAPFMWCAVGSSLKRFSPSSLRRSAERYDDATQAGMKPSPTGELYYACREGFTVDGAETRFYKACMAFPNDASLAKALADNNVAIKVVDKMRVRTRSLNDERLTRQQSLYIFEFDGEESEVVEWEKKLAEAAASAIGSMSSPAA